MAKLTWLHSLLLGLLSVILMPLGSQAQTCPEGSEPNGLYCECDIDSSVCLASECEPDFCESDDDSGDDEEDGGDDDYSEADTCESVYAVTESLDYAIYDEAISLKDCGKAIYALKLLVKSFKLSDCDDINEYIAELADSGCKKFSPEKACLKKAKKKKH